MAVGSLGVNPAAVRALAQRPGLWPAALATAWRMAAPGWWRRWPPRPAPAPTYLHFRSQTMFGGDGTRLLGPDELLDYLTWCREQRQTGRTGRGRQGAGVGVGAKCRTKAPGLAQRRG